jgi:DNA repair protein SbcC/Rad50
VRLNTLRLVNFRQHADTHLEFDSGLTGIIGPNGSGKTTILEAIAWALYGSDAARGKRESIRFSRAQPRAAVSVELDFTLSGHRYRVVRGLSNAALYLDGASQPIANSTSSVTQQVQSKLGMTLDEFFNTYFTGQKELNVMAGMGAAARGKFLSRVLGYERLRVAQELARDKRKLIVAEITGVRGVMADRAVVEQAEAESAARLTAAKKRVEAAAKGVADARRVLEAATPAWERAQRERERWVELENERKLAEKDAASLVERAGRVDTELAELASAHEELETLRQSLAPYPALVERLRAAEALYRDEGRRAGLVEYERALAGELVPLEERLGQLQAAPALEKSVEEDLAARRAELAELEATVSARQAAWQRELQEARTKLKMLLDEHRELRGQREQLVALGPEGKCPTCTRPLGEHLPEVLALLDDDAGKLEINEKYFSDRAKQLAGEPADLTELTEKRVKAANKVTALERKLSKVQAGIQELASVGRDIEAKRARRAQVAAELTTIPAGYDAVEHGRLKREVERLQPLEKRATHLGAVVERAPQLERERTRVQHDLAAAIASVKLVRERVEAIQFDEATHGLVRRRFEEAGAAVHGAQVADVQARGELDTARAAAEAAGRARSALDAAQAKLNELVRQRRLHDELDRAYADLREDLIQQMRPEVSELASGFLTELTDGRYTELELDDQYNIVVLEDSVPKPVISGGEEDLANLVLRLAISQMIAERTGQPFTLLILDEVFGSLDESRRHHVVDLLRRLHDRFEQVIVITHIESVRDGLDRVLAVRYDEARGASVVEAIAEDGTRVPLTGAPVDVEADLWAGAA